MTPEYSLIIPAYNEQQMLPGTLSAVHDAMQAVDVTGELIVVDNNSTDQTAQVAREHGAQVVFEPINQISRARNSGARVAQGQYLIFVDADTTLSAELLQQALANLQSGQCCGGGAVVTMDRPIGPAARLLLGMWNLFSVVRGSAAGCFIYCRRDAFNQTEGFSEKVYASEELWLSRNLRIWGRKQNMTFQIIRQPRIVTSARKLDHPARLMLWLPIYLLFPFAIFFRRLCAPWYVRPTSESQKT